MDVVAKKSYRIRYSKLSKLTKSTLIVYRLDNCFLGKLKGRDTGLFLRAKSCFCSVFGLVFGLVWVTRVALLRYVWQFIVIL